MTTTHAPSHGHLTILNGESASMLCLWEPGIVRSVREARALCQQGCGDASARTSAHVRAFLRTYRHHFEPVLGPVRFEHGRIRVAARSEAERHALSAAQRTAWQLGLSMLTPDGSVRVVVAARDQLALAVALRLVLGGAASEATLSGETWELTVVAACTRLYATAHRLHGSARRALSLLGFQGARGRPLSCRLNEQPYAAAQFLCRVLALGLHAADEPVHALVGAGDVPRTLTLLRSG